MVLTRRSLLVRIAIVLMLGAGALSLHAGSRQQSGIIRGRVEILDRARTGSRPNIGEIASAPAHHDALDRRASVVYLKSGPREAFAELPSGRARLDQRHEQFVPHVLAITVGTIVDFPNNDITFHNVFSLSREKPFDLGRYPAGKTKSVRFDRPGVISVFCDIHSHMSAFILVFNHPYFAITDGDGRFTIPGIPAGTYPVAVWSEAGEAEPQIVTINEGSSIETVFRVGRRR